jgi:hypothetical protein
LALGLYPKPTFFSLPSRTGAFRDHGWTGFGWDYLPDPINVPEQLGPEIQQIDGQRDLQAILEPALRDGSADLLLVLVIQNYQPLVLSFK